MLVPFAFLKESIYADCLPVLKRKGCSHYQVGWETREPHIRLKSLCTRCPMVWAEVQTDMVRNLGTANYVLLLKTGESFPGFVLCADLLPFLSNRAGHLKTDLIY